MLSILTNAVYVQILMHYLAQGVPAWSQRAASGWDPWYSSGKYFCPGKPQTPTSVSHSVALMLFAVKCRGKALNNSTSTYV